LIQNTQAARTIPLGHDVDAAGRGFAAGLNWIPVHLRAASLLELDKMGDGMRLLVGDGVSLIEGLGRYGHARTAVPVNPAVASALITSGLVRKMTPPERIGLKPLKPGESVYCLVI
jgi:hypothetical protein